MTKPVYTFGEQVGAFILIIVLATIGGLLTMALSGFKIPQIGNIFKGYEVKPCLKIVTIPPIVAMIIMGCVGRNYFGRITAGFPNDWAQWCRMSILGIILVRSGLTITFKGKGLVVLLLSILPMFLEATTNALIGMGVFNMPIEVSYSMGFVVSPVAPAIVATLMLGLTDRGFGIEKGIGGTLIASSTFDNILTLLSFGICKTILF
jgi:hypothetical protein